MGLELYWRAFHELDSCRSNSGFGAGPIPHLSVINYARAHGFSSDQEETLLIHMRSMDKSYLEYNQKKQKAKNSKTGRKANQGASGGLGR